MSDPKPLLQQLAALRSRGDIKRFAKQVDQDPALRAALDALAVQRQLPSGPDVPAKRLVRALRPQRPAPKANTRHIDEGFDCAHCGMAVPPGGRMVRDHCPRCLRTLHLDVVPGDRAADCGGVMHPVALERSGDVVRIRYQCSRCRSPWRVRAHPSDDIPPSLNSADIPDQM